jgi:hypothetical protein
VWYFLRLGLDDEKSDYLSEAERKRENEREERE